MVVTLILGKSLDVRPMVILGCTARTIRGLMEVLTTILSELVIVVAALHLTSVTRATVDWGLKVHHHIRVVMDFLVYRVLDI